MEKDLRFPGERRTWLFTLLGAGLGRIGKLFAYALQIFIKITRKWENAHNKWLGSGLDQLPWQMQ